MSRIQPVLRASTSDLMASHLDCGNGLHLYRLLSTQNPLGNPWYPDTPQSLQEAPCPVISVTFLTLPFTSTTWPCQPSSHSPGTPRALQPQALPVPCVFWPICSFPRCLYGSFPLFFQSFSEFSSGSTHPLPMVSLTLNSLSSFPAPFASITFFIF